MVRKTIMLGQQGAMQEKLMELELKRMLIPQHILVSARINFTTKEVEHMQSSLFSETKHTYDEIIKAIYNSILGIDKKKHYMRLFSYTNMVSLYQHNKAYQEQLYPIQTSTKNVVLAQVIVSLQYDQVTDSLYCFIYVIEQNQ